MYDKEKERERERKRKRKRERERSRDLDRERRIYTKGCDPVLLLWCLDNNRWIVDGCLFILSLTIDMNIPKKLVAIQILFNLRKLEISTSQKPKNRFPEFISKKEGGLGGREGFFF